MSLTEGHIKDSAGKAGQRRAELIVSAQVPSPDRLVDASGSHFPPSELKRQAADKVGR